MAVRKRNSMWLKRGPSAKRALAGWRLAGSRPLPLHEKIGIGVGVSEATRRVSA